MPEIQDVTLEDVLADAQTLGLSPEETAQGVKRWHDLTTDWAAKNVDDPDRYFAGREELSKVTAEALNGVRQAAVTQWAGQRFDDEQELDAFLSAYDETGGDPEKMGDAGGLADELNKIAGHDAWKLDKPGHDWQPLTEPGGSEIGRFRLLPRGDSTDVHLWYDGGDEGRKQAKLAVPQVTEADVTSAHEEAIKEAAKARADLEMQLGAFDAAAGMEIGGGAVLGDAIEALERREREAALRAQTLADPAKGAQLLQAERVRKAVLDDKTLREQVGQRALGEDFLRGVAGFYTGARVAWNDVTGDEAERDVWREHLRNLKQYFPGSTQRRNVGGLAGFTSEAVEGIGGMTPQIVAMLTGGGAAFNTAARTALQAGGRGMMATSLGSMGASAFGSSIEDTLSRADQLDVEASQLEADFPEAAAAMRAEAKTARANYRLIAGTKAAGEVASEFIIPEERLLLGALSGGNVLSRFGEGMAKGFVEGVAAEATSQAVDSAAFGDPVDPAELARAGALEAASGAPLVAVGSLRNAPTPAAGEDAPPPVQAEPPGERWDAGAPDVVPTARREPILASGEFDRPAPREGEDATRDYAPARERNRAVIAEAAAIAKGDKRGPDISRNLPMRSNAAPVIYSTGPANETALSSGGPVSQAGNAITEKQQLKERNYPPDEVDAFIERHFKPENYQSMAGPDTVWLVAPSTSGRNSIPELLASRLQAAHGGTVVSDALYSRSRAESKTKRGYMAKLRDPVDLAVADPATLASLQGKRVVIVDDIMTTGETTEAAASLLRQAGVDVQAFAVLAAVNEGKPATQADKRKLANILSSQTRQPLKEVLADVDLVHAYSRAKFLLRAIDEAKESNANAHEIRDLIARKARALREAVGSGTAAREQRSAVPASGAGRSSGEGSIPPLAAGREGEATQSSAPRSIPGQAPSQGNGGPGASSALEWGRRSFGKRLKTDERLRKSWRDTIRSVYRKETEAEWQSRANDFIDAEGVEGAAALFFDPESGLVESDRMALGSQLILRLDAEIRTAEAARNTERVDLLDDLLSEIAEAVDADATRFGQAIRVLGMWTRMSAEGVLRAFKKKVDKSREKLVQTTLGLDAQDVATQVADTAADERATATAEALGVSTAEQLAELQRQVEQLRQQLQAATTAATAARDRVAQATTPAEAAQAEARAQDAERQRQRAQRALATAEARQQQRAGQARQARSTGPRPRRIDAEQLAARLIDRMAQRQSDTPSGRSTQRQPNPVQSLADAYLAGRMDAPSLQAALQELEIPADQAATLLALLDRDRAAAAAVAEARERQRQQGAATRQAQAWIDRLAQSQSDTPPAARQRQVSALTQLIRDYLQAESDSLPDFIQQALALGIPEGLAGQLQRQLDAERKAIAAIARERAIARLATQLTPKLAGPRTRQRVPRFLQKLFDAHELGALGRPEFLRAFAEAFEFPVMDEEAQKKLRRLIDNQRAAPEGWMKQQATTELMAELALFKGVSLLEVGTAFWYANILSGISTQGVNLTGSAWHLFFRSLTIGLTHQPVDTLRMLHGMFIEGGRLGLGEAAAALKTGAQPYKGELNFTAGQTLELLHTDNPQTWGAYLKNGVSLGRFVFRALTAGDALFYHMAREGQAWLAASRYAREQQRLNQGDFAGYFAEQLNLSDTAFRAAQQQAEAELKAAKMPVTAKNIDRRAWEIVEQQRPEAATADARRWGAFVTYTNQPEGTMGAVAGALNDLHRRFTVPTPWGPVRVLTPVIPFVNIICNVSSAALDYTPIGIARGLLGKHVIQGLDRSAAQFSPWEARQRLATGLLSSIAYTLLYMWARGLKDEDDDRVPFMIYGMGPPSKAKRDQMPKGWKPYTLKIGDHYVSYAETPLAIGLSVLGGLLDKERYGTGTLRQEAAGYTMSLFGGALLKTGVLSSVDELMQMLGGERSPKAVLTRTATGFIPGQGLLRDISELIDGHKIDDTTLAAAFFKDVPVIRNIVGKPPLNVFGEPVQLDVMQRLPVVKRMVTGKGEDPLAMWLAQNKLWLPGMAREITVGTYLTERQRAALDARERQTRRLVRGLGEVMTPDEQYRFVQMAGQGTKEAVKAMRQLQQQMPDLSQELLQRRLSAKVLEARREAMQQLLGVGRR